MHSFSGSRFNCIELEARGGHTTKACQGSSSGSEAKRDLVLSQLPECAPAAAQRQVGSPVEAPAAPELDGRGKGQAQQLVQVEAQQLYNGRKPNRGQQCCYAW